MQARQAGMSIRIALAVVVAAVLWGGYHSHWSWTGINGHTATLWDWISLLLVPVTVATLPIWLSRRDRLGRGRVLVAAALLAAFAVVVVLGYTVPWGWTGFGDNKLWDWINLLLLPLVIATFPIWPQIRAELRLHHRALIVLVLAAFVVCAVGGYVWGWDWTGFRGNTLWDWLHLLLLPIAIPAILLPAALAITAGELMAEDEAAERG
jgi:cytochrome bd-type quinol oxidase subunit 2